MLHQNRHHHIHEDELCHQNKHHEENRGDERANTAIGQTFFGGIAVVTQCVLNTEKAQIQSVITDATRILLHTCTYFICIFIQCISYCTYSNMLTLHLSVVLLNVKIMFVFL